MSRKATEIAAALILIVLGVAACFAIVRWGHNEPTTIEAAIEAAGVEVPVEITRTARATEWLNLRRGPGVSHAVIAVLHPGEVVEIAGECEGSWCPVRTTHGAGYVDDRYIAD